MIYFFLVKIKTNDFNFLKILKSGLFYFFYESFYVDCLLVRIMRENYGVKSDYEGASRKLWGRYRGLAEAFLQRFFEKET